MIDAIRNLQYWLASYGVPVTGLHIGIELGSEAEVRRIEAAIMNESGQLAPIEVMPEPPVAGCICWRISGTEVLLFVRRES